MARRNGRQAVTRREFTTAVLDRVGTVRRTDGATVISATFADDMAALVAAKHIRRAGLAVTFESDTAIRIEVA